MNREQLIERLSFFLNAENGIGLALYFVLHEGNESIIRFADIEDEAKNELLGRFLDHVRERFIDDQEFHYQEVSQADERRNAIYRYDLDEKPATLNIQAKYLIGNSGETEPLFRQLEPIGGLVLK